jgi:adenylyl- and sulfurtransferase ThiI
MNSQYILLRYGEIFLKGQNKAFFEKKLFDNLKILTGISKIKNIRGRLITDYFPDHHKLTKVFGLVSYSPAIKVEKDFEAIKKKSAELLIHEKGTFKIEPKRSDKRFPLTSPEINVQLGKYIEAHTDLTFDGINPKHILGVEINQDGAYLFSEIIYCHGGLPVGVEGRVAALIENDTDILAALLMMKRGCNICPFGFKARDIFELQQYSPARLDFKLLRDWNEAEDFCVQNKIDILVCGQTFDRYKKIDTKLTIVRPLVAYSKKEVEEELLKFTH